MRFSLWRHGRFHGIYAYLLCSTMVPISQADDLSYIWQQALRYNPNYQAAKLDFERSIYQLDEARSQLLPNIQLQGYLSEIETNPERGGQISQNIARRGGAHNLSVEVSQPIVNAPSMYRLGESNARVNASKVKYALAKQELLVSVINQYLDIISAKAVQIISKKQVRATQKQLKLLQEKLKAGRSTLTDVYEVKTALAQAHANTYRANNNLAIAKEQIRATTGHFHCEDFSLNLLARTDLKYPKPHKRSYWHTISVSQNLARQSLLCELNADRKIIKQRSSSHLPEITAFGRIEDQGYFSRSFGNVKNQSYSFGLKLSLSLFEGGALVARTNEAVKSYEKNISHLDRLHKEIVRDINGFHHRTIALRKQINQLDEAARAAQKALSSTEEVLKVGNRTVIDYLFNLQNLLQTQEALVNAKLDYWRNWIQLKFVSGTLEESDIQLTKTWLEPMVRIRNKTIAHKSVSELIKEDQLIGMQKALTNAVLSAAQKPKKNLV